MVSLDQENKKPLGVFEGHGFTLVELVTVLAIISLLMGILLPALTRVRESTRQVVCASQLSQIGRALEIYVADTTFYPAAYCYRGASPKSGLLHWSGVFVRMGLLQEQVFHCPSVRQGGLSPANTTEDNLESGQVCASPDLEDTQVRRCAYTVNEALFPRNRFALAFEGALRVSRYVQAVRVRCPSGTIAVTEFTNDWRLLAHNGVCRSYMPVHGFQGIGPMGSDRYDLNQVGSPLDRPCRKTALYRKVSVDLLSATPTPERSYPPRLDWVGRHHGQNAHRTNFLYADGHLESKALVDTVAGSFEWGRAVYSIEGGERVTSGH